jgi:hypothetical protein
MPQAVSREFGGPEFRSFENPQHYSSPNIVLARRQMLDAEIHWSY